MKIYEIHQKKRTYMPLLLLADEQPEMIETYLSRGRMFVLDDGGVKAECVVTDEGSGPLYERTVPPGFYPAPGGNRRQPADCSLL